MTAFLVLAAAILVVHGADLVYSAYAIYDYGLKEGNPLLRGIVRYPLPLGLVYFSVLGLVLSILKTLGCPAWALGFGLAARVLVMVRNVNIVRREKSTRGDKGETYGDV